MVLIPVIDVTSSEALTTFLVGSGWYTWAPIIWKLQHLEIVSGRYLRVSKVNECGSSVALTEAESLSHGSWVGSHVECGELRIGYGLPHHGWCASHSTGSGIDASCGSLLSWEVDSLHVGHRDLVVCPCEIILLGFLKSFLCLFEPLWWHWLDMLNSCSKLRLLKLWAWILHVIINISNVLIICADCLQMRFQCHLGLAVHGRSPSSRSERCKLSCVRPDVLWDGSLNWGHSRDRYALIIEAGLKLRLGNTLSNL